MHTCLFSFETVQGAFFPPVSCGNKFIYIYMYICVYMHTCLFICETVKERCFHQCHVAKSRNSMAAALHAL